MRVGDVDRAVSSIAFQLLLLHGFSAFIGFTAFTAREAIDYLAQKVLKARRETLGSMLQLPSSHESFSSIATEPRTTPDTPSTACGVVHIIYLYFAHSDQCFF